MTVIPDSIEPVIAWKALRVKNGKLWSPSRNTLWPPGHKLEAECPYHGTSGWKLIPLIQRPKPHPRNDTPPGLPPPPNMHWSWEQVPDHQPVEHSCSCGIYAVSKPILTLGYLGTDGVIVQVALWGKTIVGTQGWRAQYAYPKRIYCCDPEQAANVEQLADRYQVPVEIGPPDLNLTEPDLLLRPPARWHKTELAVWLGLYGINTTTLIHAITTHQWINATVAALGALVATAMIRHSKR